MPSFRKLFVIAALAMAGLAMPLEIRDTVARTSISDTEANIERNPLSEWTTPLPEEIQGQPSEPEVDADLK